MISSPSENCPGVELLIHVTFLFSIFWGISILFFLVAELIYIPINNAQRFPFLRILSNTYFLFFGGDGEEWGQEEKEAEDEMVGWYHRLNGHEFEQTLWDGEGQESLAYCNPQGRKESGMTEGLNNKPTYYPVSSFFGLTMYHG